MTLLPIFRSKCFFFLVLILFVVILNVIYIFPGCLLQFLRDSKSVLTTNKTKYTDNMNIMMNTLNTTNTTDYLIITKTCKVPKTSDKIIHSKGFKVPNCSYIDLLSTMDDESQILTLLPKYQNTNCCLQRVTRIDLNDNGYKLSNCEAFNKSQFVKNDEMLITKCGDQMNFEANLMITPIVQKKLQSWKNIPKIKQPMSVLILGIESMSRSRAHRIFPKTLKYMKEMGFIDFKGYFALEGNSLPNLFAFLTGLSFGNIRSTCAPSWGSPHDTCPFIWKQFSDRNFITMFIEDGQQSFNMAGMSGFHYRPTDFYIHPIFTVMHTVRDKYKTEKLKMTASYENTDRYTYCFSSETTPEFLLRYLKRFITKFIQVPKFSFSFIANPFHNHDFGEDVLSSYDDKYLDLATFLNSNTEILDDTVIIFIGDHGSTKTSTLERVVERELPLLFIRIPEKLKKKYPNQNILQNIKLNSERLTSPYDVHETLLHILAIDENNATLPTTKFYPNLLTPSSLLMPVNLDRSCYDIHAGRCICDIRLHLEPVLSIYIDKMKSFAMMKLNEIVNNSNYRNICEIWKWSDLLNTTTYHKTLTYTDNVFQFRVNPMDAWFEIPIRILNQEEKLGECQLLGDIRRINMYGKQSWCVKSDTDFDRRMKGFCMCKQKKINKIKLY